jgi:hypothetical protein
MAISKKILSEINQGVGKKIKSYFNISDPVCVFSVDILVNFYQN